MKRVTIALICLLCVVAPLAAGQADGTPPPNAPSGGPTDLVVGGGWYNFSWGQSGVPVPTSPGPWNFDAPSLVRVTIVDTDCPGDEFQTYDSGLAGPATPAGTANDCIGGGVDDPDAALADPRFSRVVYELSQGSHSIAIEVIDNPYGFGGLGGYIRVDAIPAQAIPTLSTWGVAALLLVLAGLGALAIRRRGAAGV